MYMYMRTYAWLPTGPFLFFKVNKPLKAIKLCAYLIIYTFELRRSLVPIQNVTHTNASYITLSYFMTYSL